MNKKSTKEKCTICGDEASTYNGVYITQGNTSNFFCSKCYNRSISELMGLNFDHLSFHSISMADVDGTNHTFDFQARLFGDMVSIHALEIKKGIPRGYEFSIHGDAEEDLFDLFAKLVDRIRRELGRKHIEPSDLTRYSITK